MSYDLTGYVTPDSCIQGASSLICKFSIEPTLFLQSNSITRPTGGAAAAILFFFLNLNPHEGRPFKEHMETFDFLGLFLIVGGVICLLLGFNESETSCMLIQCWIVAGF